MLWLSAAGLRSQFVIGSLLGLALPLSAQVEKVAMRTTGISCGMCAGLSEIYFRRMPGVDQVKISLSQEAVMLTYKPGAAFEPEKIRKILESMEVGVRQFQISARGYVSEQGGARFFIAGKDKFALADTSIPVGKPVAIEAILDDRARPMAVRILNFR